jgi:hypothetical protein
MVRGLLKAGSALAIVAASVAISMPANAADYGGDCCADLEERVAELEATAVKHGNRKVSMTISGSVTEAVIFWDDGVANDVNVIVPDYNGAGFKFAGEGKVNGDVSVGYVMALDVRVGDPGDGGDLQSGVNGGSKVAVGDEFVYLASASAGRLTIGKRGDAYGSARNYDSVVTDDAAGITMINAAGVDTGKGWGDVLGGLGDTGGMIVRYDSPSLAGFTLGVSWGNDDVAAGYVGYAGSFSGTNVSVAVGALDNMSGATGVVRYSVNGSISNDASGLFLQGAYETEDATDKSVSQVKAGWGQNVTGLGKTGIYGVYSVSENFAKGIDATGLGMGVSQDLDSVGATLFVRYDTRSADGTAADFTAAGLGTGVKDLSTVLAGMTVRF